VEIKRVIAAASRAGVDIGSIEIHPRKIIIHPRDDAQPSAASEYDMWKMSRRENTDLLRYADEKSAALPKKPRG